MRFANAVTVLLSVVVSVAGAILVTYRHGAGRAFPIKTTTIQLVDKSGRVRMTLGTLDSEDGRPEIEMTDPAGKALVILSTNSRDEGTLYFSSARQEGKVAVGYLWGSDTPSAGEDPLGSWGLRVLGQNLSSTGIAVGNNGQVLRWPDHGEK